MVGGKAPPAEPETQDEFDDSCGLLAMELKVFVRNLLSLGTGLLALTGGEHPKMVLRPIPVISWEKIFCISAWFFSRPKLTLLSCGGACTATEPDSCSERSPFLSDINPL